LNLVARGRRTFAFRAFSAGVKHMWRHLGLVTVLASTVTLWAGIAARGEEPPIDLKDPAQVAEGQTTFNRTCTGYCHGRDGLQGRAPSLRGREDLSSEQIHTTISNGRRSAGKIMPAWKGQLDDQKIWQITAFILSLREQH
jgi:mono/diheme cytochrome c family protein